MTIRDLAFWRRPRALAPVAAAASSLARAAAVTRLAAQVTTYAEAGLHPAEIARRTGMAHDAVALLLHLRGVVCPEVPTGRGTMCRAGTASHELAA